jgi:hypothetical protein
MTTTEELPDGAATAPRISTASTTKNTEAEDRPDFERPALQRMREHWRLPDLLLTKTRGMQEAGTEVLTQEVDESPEEYERRRRNTCLTGYYEHTIDSHSGMPFGKLVQFDPPLPELLEYLHRDADGTGKSITVLARDLMRDGIHRGMCHVLVDIPRGKTESYADVLARQPRMVHIGAPDLLDVQEEPTKAGDVVVYARFRQSRETRLGTFGIKTEQTIVEVDAKQQASIEWSQTKGGEWVASEVESYTRDSVPLFTFYAKHKGPYEAEPAYEPLAELNLAHYQIDADYRHALTHGMRGTLVLTGWPTDTSPASALAKGVAPEPNRTVLGYKRKLRHANDGARATMMETNGAPVAAGREALADMEKRMERFGAAQVSQGGGITATGRELDNRRDTCNLEAWCTRLEATILDALRAAAAWRKVELPANQRVMIPRDWASDGPKKEHVPQLLAIAREGFLSRETMIREIIARGMLATVTDPSEEVDRIRAQGETDVEASMQAMAEKFLGERAGTADNGTGGGGAAETSGDGHDDGGGQST